MTDSSVTFYLPAHQPRQAWAGKATSSLPRPVECGTRTAVAGRHRAVGSPALRVDPLLVLLRANHRGVGYGRRLTPMQLETSFFFGTTLLVISIERVFGALKGLR